MWIFLGYSELDDAKVSVLYDRLYGAGFRPWAEMRDLLPTDDISSRLRVAIRSADFFLACLSNNSVDERGHLEQSLHGQLNLHLQGAQTKAYLIPVRLDECHIPASLSSFEHVDLFKNEGWDQLLEIINTVVRRRKETKETWAEMFSDLELDVSSRSALTGEVYPREEDEGVDGPADPSSASAWGVDLRRLLSGHRELSLIQLGGVEEYVEMNLAEAADAEQAEQSFHEALEMLVQTWQPSTLDNLHLTYLFDLLRVYTPQGGFVKVVEFILHLKALTNVSRSEDQSTDDDDIFSEALSVLESYTRVPPWPPEDTSAAYKTYIDLLKEELWNPRQSGYALKRLVELKVVQLKDIEIKRFIEKSPLVLRELINLVLNPGRRSDAEDNLTRLFTYCLDIGVESVYEFERAVALCGGKVDFSATGFIYLTYRGEELRLRVSEEALYKYQGIHWKRTEQEWFVGSQSAGGSSHR